MIAAALGLVLSGGLALGQLEFSKTAEIVPGHVIESIIVDRIGLDQNPPRPVAPTSPASNLAEQGEHPFGTAKVRQVECRVGIQNPDQCDRREIMPLGDHLRADQHVDLPGRHLVDQSMVCSLARSGVTVHTRHPGVGKTLPDFFFEAFCSHPLRQKAGTAAAITAVRWRLAKVAVMTAQGMLDL